MIDRSVSIFGAGPGQAAEERGLDEERRMQHEEVPESGEVPHSSSGIRHREARR
jgi:hypothetical protein